MGAARSVLILAGGRSEEHAISLLSAQALVQAMADTPYTAAVQVISRTGGWLSPAASRAALAAGRADAGGVPMTEALAIVHQHDLVFPLIHGPYGEDGRLQGLLEMAAMPYVGAGVLASAICMDKGVSKQVLAAANIPQVDYVLLGPVQLDDAALSSRLVSERLPPPWFVKPANLGSSVGISKVLEARDLPAAIAAARAHDRRVIVEAGLSQVRELEVGVLGNRQLSTSIVGEITYQGDFYDYATKYTPGRAQMHVPAEIPAAVQAQIQDLAARAYAQVDCAGMARVDFFYRPETGAVYLNELNTLPGFTPFSMFPSLWQASGRSYPELIQALVELALERAQGRS